MKYYINYFKLLFFIGIISLSGCGECDQTVCPPLSETGKAWINSMENINGDTVRYCNAAGDCIEFYKYQKEFRTPIQPLCETEGFKCHCDSYCNIGGSLGYVTDSSINDYRSLNFDYSEQINQVGPSSSIFVWALDFVCIYHSQMSLSPADSFLSTINLNNHTYQNVYAMRIDTLLYPDKIVWKSYFSKTDGLIAFWQRPSGQLYIRQ